MTVQSWKHNWLLYDLSDRLSHIETSSVTRVQPIQYLRLSKIHSVQSTGTMSYQHCLPRISMHSYWRCILTALTTSNLHEQFHAVHLIKTLINNQINNYIYYNNAISLSKAR